MRIGRLVIRCNGSFGQQLALSEMSETCGPVVCDPAKLTLFHRVGDKVTGALFGERRTWHTNRRNRNQEDKQPGNFQQSLAPVGINGVYRKSDAKDQGKIQNVLRSRRRINSLTVPKTSTMARSE